MTVAYYVSTSSQYLHAVITVPAVPVPLVAVVVERSMALKIHVYSHYECYQHYVFVLLQLLTPAIQCLHNCEFAHSCCRSIMYSTFATQALLQ